jgi:alpha-beta hydrolase superfamily lysophospholipase
MDSHSWIETSDGLELYLHHWPATCDSVSALVIIHGLGEHGGRYDLPASRFNDHGISVTAPDLRGHGRSGGRKGFFPQYTAWMDDISRTVAETSKRNPDLPIFLYGHSMGGNLSINFVLRENPPVSGVIASAPLLRIRREPPLWKRSLGAAMLKLFPRFTMSNGIRSEDLSRDCSIVKAYDDDPLVHDRVAPGFLHVRKAGLWALDHAGALGKPLLLMHGTRDRITSHEASREFAEKAGVLCTLRIWDGLYHELHNEPEKEEVIDFVLAWISRILCRNAGD